MAAGRQRDGTRRIRPARVGGGRGQGLVEYGIILGLTALFIVILLVLFDDQVATVLGWLSAQLP